MRGSGAHRSVACFCAMVDALKSVRETFSRSSGVCVIASRAARKWSSAAAHSREAAQECSPHRKVWVPSGRRPSPRGAKEKVRHRLLRDLPIAPTFPALKRRAIGRRPSGAPFQSVSFHRVCGKGPQRSRSAHVGFAASADAGRIRAKVRRKKKAPRALSSGRLWQPSPRTAKRAHPMSDWTGCKCHFRNVVKVS